MPAGQRVVEGEHREKREEKCSFGIFDLLSVDKSKEEFMMI